MNWNSVEERIAELLSPEATDDGAIRVSDTSLSDMRAFLRDLDIEDRPSIFLGEDGRFSIRWETPSIEDAAVLFLGEGNVRFSVIGRRLNTGARPAPTSYGDTTLAACFDAIPWAKGKGLPAG